MAKLCSDSNTILPADILSPGQTLDLVVGVEVMFVVVEAVPCQIGLLVGGSCGSCGGDGALFTSAVQCDICKKMSTYIPFWCTGSPVRSADLESKSLK